MITKEFLMKHFKYNGRLTLYQGQIPVIVCKAWHLHLSGGHHELDINDCEDLAQLCNERGLTTYPVHTTTDEGKTQPRDIGIISL